MNNVSNEYQRLYEKDVKSLGEHFRIQTGLAVEFEDPFENGLGITDYSSFIINERLRYE